MKHEIYIFGSITRGEVSLTSDVDILVIPLGLQRRECYPDNWSVYSAELVETYYRLGRLFAWHLHLEAKCLYSQSTSNLLERLGTPAPYVSDRDDIDALESILNESLDEIRLGTNSLIYELGIVHTAIRDIAMSASWKMLGKPTFSRESPYLLPLGCPLPKDVYIAAMIARHSSTRGGAMPMNPNSIAEDVLAAPLSEWINQIKRQL